MTFKPKGSLPVSKFLSKPKSINFVKKQPEKKSVFRATTVVLSDELFVCFLYSLASYHINV